MCIIGMILMEFRFEIADALLNSGIVILIAVLPLTILTVLIEFCWSR